MHVQSAIALSAAHLHVQFAISLSTAHIQPLKVLLIWNGRDGFAEIPYDAVSFPMTRSSQNEKHSAKESQIHDMETVMLNSFKCTNNEVAYKIFVLWVSTNFLSQVGHP